jgi:hypothetical protein
MNMKYAWRRQYNKYKTENLLTINSVLADFKKNNRASLMKDYSILASKAALSNIIDLGGDTYNGFYFSSKVSEKRSGEALPDSANNIHQMLVHIVVDKDGRTRETEHILSEYTISEEHVARIRQISIDVIEDFKEIIFISRKIGEDVFYSEICESLFTIGNLVPVTECEELIGAEWFQMMVRFARSKAPFTRQMVARYLELDLFNKIKNSEEFKEYFWEIEKCLENQALAFSIIKSYLSKGPTIYVVNTLFDIDNFQRFLSLPKVRRAEYWNSCAIVVKALNKIGVHRMSTGDVLRAACRKKIYTRAIGGPRLATVNEIEYGIEELYEEDDNIVEELERIYLTALRWAQFGAEEDFREVMTNIKEPLTKFLDKLIKINPLLEEAAAWVDEPIFLERMAEIKLRHNSGDSKYPGYADDEITGSSHIQSIIKYIEANKNLAYDRNRGFAYVIASEYEKKRKELRFTKLHISVKQIGILREAYKVMTASAAEAEKYKETEPPVDREQTAEGRRAEVMAKALMLAKQAHKISQNEFVFQVLKTLEKWRFTRVSEKQFIIVEDAFKKYAQEFLEDVKALEKDGDVFEAAPANLGVATGIDTREGLSTSSNSSITDVSDLLGAGRIISL